MTRILQLGMAIVMLCLLGFIADRSLVRGDSYVRARTFAQVLASVKLSDYAHSATTLRFPAHARLERSVTTDIIEATGPLAPLLADQWLGIGAKARDNAREIADVIKDALAENGVPPTFTPAPIAALLPLRGWIAVRDDLTINQIFQLVRSADAKRDLEQVVPDKDQLKTVIRDTMAGNPALQQDLYGINLLYKVDDAEHVMPRLFFCNTKMKGDEGRCAASEATRIDGIVETATPVKGAFSPIEGSNFKSWFEREFANHAVASGLPHGSFELAGADFGDLLLEIGHRTPDEAIKYLDEQARLAPADIRYGDLLLTGVRAVRAVPLVLAALCLLFLWNVHVLAVSPRAVLQEAAGSVTYALYFRPLGATVALLFVGLLPAGFTLLVLADLCVTSGQMLTVIAVLALIVTCAVGLNALTIRIRRRVAPEADRNLRD